MPATSVSPLTTSVDFDQMLEASWARNLHNKSQDLDKAVQGPIVAQVESTMEVDNQLAAIESN